MPKMPRLIVFTDLDGTLLDHSDYSYVAASEALQQLRDHKIPLILASSKTAIEINSIRDALGFGDCPAIVENGAGILPAGNLDDRNLDSAQYYKLTEIIDTAPARLRSFYKGFHNWSVQEISHITGLPLDAAEKSSKRQFSEPGLWYGNESDRELFINYLNTQGVSFRHGGRFMTLSFGSNKGLRVGEIIASYSDPNYLTISLALGDAPNDVEMIQATNFGTIIPNTHGTPIPHLDGEDNGTISRAPHPGPKGWNQSVLEFIQRHLQQ